MNAITIEGKKIEISDKKSTLDTHMFVVTFEDGDTDLIGLQNPASIDRKWLEGNFDIEGTDENINTFKTWLL